MPSYYPGSTITLYGNYVDGNGSPVVTGISNVLVNVYHYNNGVKTYTLTTGTMTQDLTNPSTFYYEYVIPQLTPWTNSIAEYDAIYSGTNIQNKQSLATTPRYQDGANITFYQNYVDGNGTPITGSIASPNLDIYYYHSGTKFYNVSGAAMTQDLTNPSMFYYEYLVPTSGLYTNSVVQYNAVYSGTSLQSTETFYTIPQPQGNGTTIVQGTVVNVSGSGIQNAAVSAVLFTGNTTPVASTVTDISGNYILYLDANNYNVQYSAINYMTNSVTQSVPAGMTTWSWGTTTLLPVLDGPIVISDTYLGGEGGQRGFYRGEGWDDGCNVPLSGMRVSLFASSTTASSALAVTWTDVSGTFSMNVYGGRYVLLVEGNQPNRRVYQTAYDIDVDPHFQPNNFRYLGTSQYRFLI